MKLRRSLIQQNFTSSFEPLWQKRRLQRSIKRVVIRQSRNLILTSTMGLTEVFRRVRFIRLFSSNSRFRKSTDSNFPQDFTPKQIIEEVAQGRRSKNCYET